MKCNDIQERFIDLLYQEKGTPSSSPELEAHIQSCPACRKELVELKGLQTTLKAWKDEPPLRPVVIPRSEPAGFASWIPAWRLLRYAAVAALVVIAFLGVANADIQWNREGFSFKTHLLSTEAVPSASGDYYTRQEVQAIVGRILDESREMDLQMGRRLLETIDQQDMNQFLNSKMSGSRSKN